MGPTNDSPLRWFFKVFCKAFSNSMRLPASKIEGVYFAAFYVSLSSEKTLKPN